MEVTFLDVTVYKGERFQATNILDLKTHIKDTNKQLENSFDSNPLADMLDVL